MTRIPRAFAQRVAAGSRAPPSILRMAYATTPGAHSYATVRASVTQELHPERPSLRILRPAGSERQQQLILAAISVLEAEREARTWRRGISLSGSSSIPAKSFGLEPKWLREPLI